MESSARDLADRAAVRLQRALKARHAPFLRPHRMGTAAAYSTPVRPSSSAGKSSGMMVINSSADTIPSDAGDIFEGGAREAAVS